MALDMHTWSEKALDSIARKMKRVERRLDLSRGGPKTQKIQKEVVARLDEIIKELENQSGGGGGGHRPRGGPGGPPGDTPQPPPPAAATLPGHRAGPGARAPQRQKR